MRIALQYGGKNITRNLVQFAVRKYIKLTLAGQGFKLMMNKTRLGQMMYRKTRGTRK